MLFSSFKRLHAGLKELGFTLATEKVESPIIAVCLPDPLSATVFWEALLLSGVYTNLALPPATPAGFNLLRVSMCAQHTTEQIDTIIERFKAVLDKTEITLES